MDFETKILVKHDVAERFREFLAKPAWKPEPICFSGVTDCYQPAEGKFRLTRQCLEVALSCRQPISIITKNALIVRDLDLLAPLAQKNLLHVFLSITTLDAALARQMEPRTSTPEARLRAIRMLRDMDIPTGVLAAPVIPGLNDTELPNILAAASDAGAAAAWYILLRLPLTVEPVFREWLERTQPMRAERILNRIRSTREGQLNSTKWRERMVGSGQIADQIKSLFRAFRKKHGLDRSFPPHDCSLFEPPDLTGQRRLF